MPKIAYRPWPSARGISAEHLMLVTRADQFAQQYQAQGYSLTLRQLYYRFVAAGIIANKQTEYKRLGDLIADARYAGMIDWSHLEDRTRNSHVPWSWTDPRAIIRQSQHSYKTPKWLNQPWRVEVWVEKDALVNVVERVAERLDVTHFSCRGYTSASEMWSASQRLMRHMEEYTEDGQRVRPIIIHLGDHDPSGIDMTVDIEARLMEFMWNDFSDKGEDAPEWMEQYGWYSNQQAYAKAIVDGEVEPVLVRRVALNLDQIQQYNPPPNPAKTTDSRFDRYMQRTGLTDSWELDALEPAVLDAVVDTNVRSVLDMNLFNEQVRIQRQERGKISSIFADHYDDILEYAGRQGWRVEANGTE